MYELSVGRIGSPVGSGIYRILVDRLWPRGVAKISAPWDLWMKNVAPSTALRKWYGHETTRYEEFRQRYLGELEEQWNDGALSTLWDRWMEQPVILLTATKVIETSQAPILRDFLKVRATENSRRQPS